MPSLVEKVSAKPATTIILLGLILFLSGTWILPLMDRDEPRFAEASREMRQRADWVIPWFNGQYRFDKPPLIYWCQIASYRLLGENAFAARLPTALFSVATAVLLWFWGRRLGNEKAGFYAALILMTCMQMLIHGRLAVADMPMIFFVTTGAWSGWEMTRLQPEPPVSWWSLFYLSLGLGFLAKGPVAWLPLGGLFLGRWLRPKDFHLSAVGVLGGSFVVLLLVGLWGVPALLDTHGQFFTVGIGHHVIFRSFGIMEGHGGQGWFGFLLTLPLYFGTFFFSFFPWALKMPRALRNWFDIRSQDLFGWYLLVQAGLVFATFTFVRTKLIHYTLPAFPLLSLWLALRMAGEPDSAKWMNRAVPAMCALSLLITLAGFAIVRPYFVAADLWHQAQPLCSPKMEFAAIGFNEPSLVWEFRRELTNYIQQLTPEQAGQFLQKPGPRLLILPTSQFAAGLSGVSTNFSSFRSVGLDTVRFKKLDLTAVVKTDDR